MWAQQGGPSSIWGPVPPAPKPGCPPACLQHPRPAARTHRVDAKGVGSQEDTGDIGVQCKQRVLGQECVTVGTAGRVFREAGTRSSGDLGASGAGRQADLTSTRTGWPWPPRSSPTGR